MKLHAYLLGTKDVPIISKLTGISEEDLTEKVRAAEAEGNLCVFDLEVTAEQYLEIQKWKNERKP